MTLVQIAPSDASGCRVSRVEPWEIRGAAPVPAEGMIPSESRDSAHPWRLAFALAALALAANLALAGTAATFLAAVALAGAGPGALAFNIHHPAALVRLFALLRTGARYGERMAGHRAALGDQVRRRSRLFAALARAPESRGSGWQLGRPERLADYIDDVADIDFARLRVDFALATTGTALLALTAATAWLAPLALVPLVGLALASLALCRATARCLTTREAQVRAARRRGAAEFGAVLAGAVPLAAEARRGFALRSALDSLRDAERETAAGRRALARFESLLGLAGPGAALAVLLAAWTTGQRGTGLLPATFLAFAWLGITEPALALARSLLGAVRARAARAALKEEEGATPEPELPTVTAAGALALCGVRLRAPDGRDLGPAPDLTIAPGCPLVLFGASGCGKTSLLKALAGWSDDRPGEAIRLDGRALTAVERRTVTHLALHDAAILADTVRENLFAPGAADSDLWAALATVELDGRIREGGGLDAWIGEGTLSLGEAQRLALARAALSPAPVILLDEPAEHLGDDQAGRILGRLLAGWEERTVVLTSHRPDLALPARIVSLDAGIGAPDRAVIAV
ncbi:ABC-type transport system involved in cytochrome bd biosynthesis, fused ATPase and permease components [Methylorubrum salsuginis]|uniref:ABC-type transport system involved in cytochrome bd biosynthesis, fused ATPase and permease components n=2 Tax=Methylorubrum salsuginis TaxID=414703 RepID=A0A1I4D967_9HYPH|nr:ABC-type transport system involved in cytochrome bd biosynthesis, fused ATPase and permease components [Methylorubrum salsuginis]